jgi:hypothetical protein
MAKDIWGIPIPDAKDVVSYINNTMNTLMIASGDKPALTPGANAVRRSGEAVSYVNSAINPFAETSKKVLGQAAGKPGANKALAKSVGVDAVVALTAALGGKIASKGAEAIVNTGLPDRIANTVKRERILVHGSPKPNLNVIYPKTGSARFPDDKVAFGWNTKWYGYRDPDGIVGRAMEYTGTLSDNATAGLGKLRGTMRAASPGGSIYITRADKTKNIVKDPDESYMMAIKDRMPVIKEYKLSDYISDKTINTRQLAADVKEGLKLAGVKTDPNVAEKLLDKAEAAKLARRARKERKNSPV